MFTGIVEEIGTVRRISSREVDVAASLALEGTKAGDSVAVNGVCLTVTALDAGGFTADVMPETFRRSNLGDLRPGDRVDLERAMAADGRFGGHLVSGHIDGVGTISRLRREGNAVWLTVAAPPELLRYVVEKGSVAVDGVSLTVAALTKSDFSVSLIPHTGAGTILLGKKPGERVNLENDVVGKYVARLLGLAGPGPAPESRITMDFLRANGF